MVFRFDLQAGTAVGINDFLWGNLQYLCDLLAGVSRNADRKLAGDAPWRIERENP